MASEIFRKRSSVKMPKEKHVLRHEEYGAAEKVLVICPSCHNILFKKEWHHPISNYLKKFNKKGRDVHFHLCPACKMIRGGSYEGEIIISDVPAKFELELMHLIAAYGHRAQDIDPQHRIIDIKKQNKNGYRVTTTENQLAVKLAKKIKSVFKKVALQISYSQEPFEVDTIRVRFLQ